MSSGGKREGAGRPRKANRQALNVRLSVEVIEEIRHRAAAQRKSLGEIVEQAVILSKDASMR